jgi:hypothetical protein
MAASGVGGLGPVASVRYLKFLSFCSFAMNFGCTKDAQKTVVSLIYIPFSGTVLLTNHIA